MARLRRGTEPDSWLRAFLPGLVSPAMRVLTEIDAVLPGSFQSGGVFLKEYRDGFRLRVGRPVTWPRFRYPMVLMLRVRIYESPSGGCDLVANGSMHLFVRIFFSIWFAGLCFGLSVMAGVLTKLMPRHSLGHLPWFLWVAVGVACIGGALVFRWSDRMGGDERDELFELIEEILSLNTE